MEAERRKRLAHALGGGAYIVRVCEGISIVQVCEDMNEALSPARGSDQCRAGLGLPLGRRGRGDWEWRVSSWPVVG